jgi:hypothetical protein
MLKAPSWSRNAKPTNRGWVDSKTGELLVSRKHSDREVTEYMMAQLDTPAPAPAPKVVIEADPVIEEAAPTAEVLVEADPVQQHPDHSTMTKAQLIEHAAEEHGMELDPTLTKSKMIAAIEG